MERTIAVTLGLVLVLSGVVVFVTVAELPDNRPHPETCNAPYSHPGVGETPAEQSSILIIEITPQKRQISRNKTAVFLVCIANPVESNESANQIITFQHSGTKEELMHIVGPDVSLVPTSNHVGTLPMDVEINDGMGRYVYPGPIEPGEVVQYTIVGSNLSETGVYDIRVGIPAPTGGQNEATLTVTCPPSCAIAVGIEAINVFLNKYGMFILAIIGTIVSILGFLVALYGKDAVLSALRFWNESESSRTSERSDEEP